MWNLFTVGSLQFPNGSTIASLEANQNRPEGVIMIMNCFREIIDQRKAFSLISSWNHCHRFSPPQISNVPQAGFEPALNLSLNFIE